MQFPDSPENASQASQSRMPAWVREGAIVITILLVFVIANLVTSLAIQHVWLDEVTVADPAVNLFLGNGFTSSGWQYQAKDEFWASNAPLHQILLYHWMFAFGFNPLGTRSLNFVLMAGLVLCIWGAIYRLKIVTHPGARIGAVVLLLLGAGTTFNYVSGRYDCIGILLLAAAFLAYSIESLWLRTLVLATVGIFIPIAGINLIPYAILLGAILLFYLGIPWLREATTLTVGGAIGCIFLYVLYATNGVAKTILVSAGGHALASAVEEDADIGAAGLGAKIAYVIGNLPQILATRFSGLPRWFLMDPSFVLLLGFIVAIAIIYRYQQKRFAWRSVLSFGLVACISIPLILGLLRDYPFYYSWMAYIPATVVATSLMGDLWQAKTRYRYGTHVAILALVVLACLPGYPMRLFGAIRQGNFPDLGYAEMVEFANENLQESDRVYSEFAAYYPVKQKAASVLLPTYQTVMSPAEKEELSVLILKPENYAEITAFVGGQWQEQASLSVSHPYRLNIYRRQIKSQSSSRFAVKTSLKDGA